jgi:hypothetical protein
MEEQSIYDRYGRKLGWKIQTKSPGARPGVDVLALTDLNRPEPTWSG